MTNVITELLLRSDNQPIRDAEYGVRSKGERRECWKLIEEAFDMELGQEWVDKVDVTSRVPKLDEMSASFAKKIVRKIATDYDVERYQTMVFTRELEAHIERSSVAWKLGWMKTQKVKADQSWPLRIDKTGANVMVHQGTPRGMGSFVYQSVQ